MWIMAKDDIPKCQAILKTEVEKLYPGYEALFDHERVMYLSMKVVSSNGDILFTAPNYVRYSNIWDIRNKPQEIQKTLCDWEARYKLSLQVVKQ
jgi:hypothetical protein